MLANWQREHTMEDILMQLKKEMMSPQNRKLTQPPEGLPILTFVAFDMYFYILFNFKMSEFFWELGNSLTLVGLGFNFLRAPLNISFSILCRVWDLSITYYVPQFL